MSSNHNQIQSKAILRPPEAARYLGLSESTLAKQRLRGDGPRYVKLGSRAVGYSINELDAYLEACTRCSTSECGE